MDEKALARALAEALTPTVKTAQREIMDGHIFFLSLVDEGANNVVPLLKGANLERIESVAKMSKEGLLHTLVYGPNNTDTHGDISSKQGVQNLAHKFIPSMIGSGIDIMHNCKPVDTKDAHICESFIIQKNGDDRFKGVVLNGRAIEDTSELEGWWASIIKLNAPELRRPFESGEWKGVSMYGPARVAPVAKQSDFASALASRLGFNTPRENDMDEKALAQALATALSPLFEKVDNIAKSIEAPADTKTDTSTAQVPTEQPAIEFEGDPNSLEDVEAHEEKVFRASLDFNKAADLKKWRNYLAEKATKADSDADGADETVELKKAKDNLAAAERRVAELKKASNQSTEDVKSNETDVERVARIRKSAKETARDVLRDQGRLPAEK